MFAAQQENVHLRKEKRYGFGENHLWNRRSTVITLEKCSTPLFSMQAPIEYSVPTRFSLTNSLREISVLYLDRYTNRQTDRHTDRQTDRLTEKVRVTPA